MPHKSIRPCAAALVFAAVVLLGCTTSGPPTTTTNPELVARWQSPGLFSQSYTLFEGSFTVSDPQQQTVAVSLEGGRFLSLPEGCYGSSTVNIRSTISAAVDSLDCWLQSGDGSAQTVSFFGLVVAAPGQLVRATVKAEDGSTYELPARVVTPGPPPPTSYLRLLSSPDFVNGDVGDLAEGPNYWTPGDTENSINDDYQRALDTVLDDWKALAPDAVLVAGDLVNGWWGIDPGEGGNFGPVETLVQRRAALRRAAATYYPQWLERFTQRDLAVLPAMGDHELGDNPWPRRKRILAPSFERAFARHFGELPEVVARRVSRPTGTRDRGAYALRPRPDVQLVTLNVVDISSNRERLRLDRAQMTWLRDVLAEAEQDRVSWIIVQGHLPILGPVRVRGSSGLSYQDGRQSALWKLFARYGVDLYLAGEAHDVTASEADGVTQIVHGGAFQYGLTNYLVLDITESYAYLTLRDYDVARTPGRDGGRLWESRPPGLPGSVEIRGEPFTIGTGVLLADGDLTRQSGVLKPRRR